MKKQLIRLSPSFNKSRNTYQQQLYKRSVYLNFLENKNNFSTFKSFNCANTETLTKTFDLESSNTVVRNNACSSHNVCHGCGKSLRPVPTLNGKFFFILLSVKYF